VEASQSRCRRLRLWRVYAHLMSCLLRSKISTAALQLLSCTAGAHARLVVVAARNSAAGPALATPDACASSVAVTSCCNSSDDACAGELCAQRASSSRAGSVSCAVPSKRASCCARPVSGGGATNLCLARNASCGAATAMWPCDKAVPSACQAAVRRSSKRGGDTVTASSAPSATSKAVAVMNRSCDATGGRELGVN